ncbi:MAG: glycosyltransferase family 4 protein [Verrucomicrobia bacterium]|nr:glycosyltransferase family 4 protein [Verrucomicrobiota bacterium]MCH8514229.1 glycosyltransferase family 4 protein [Kiritimatiellia bacterium]
MNEAPKPSLFAFYRRTEARTEALRSGDLGGHGSHLFMGADLLQRHGWHLETNIPREPGRFAHQLGTRVSNFLFRTGAYGGDFPTCLANLGRANHADVVWSTVDTTGIPLAWLKRVGRLHPPLVYTSIGLPERLDGLRPGKGRDRLLRALGTCDRMLCFGWEEARRLREILPEMSEQIRFVPYGVDTEAWQPLETAKTVDVLSLGMDWQRDFGALRHLAESRPDLRLKFITSPELAEKAGPFPSNVRLSPPVPLKEIPREMAAAKVVTLPVKENTYSGATTTLLQAMSMGLPVVVSRVGAIREGYGFETRDSCRLVAPDSPGEMAEAVIGLLADEAERAALGARARAHAVQDFAWSAFVSRVEDILRALSPQF